MIEGLTSSGGELCVYFIDGWVINSKSDGSSNCGGPDRKDRNSNIS